MPTITRKQYETRQAQAPMGWRYDLQKAVVWGEHEITRRVDIDADHYLSARVCYVAEHVDGSRWQLTGRQIPCLHVSYWTLNAERTAATSQGMGSKYIPIGEPQTKKIYKALCKFAEHITEENIMDIYTAQRKKLLDPCLI